MKTACRDEVLDLHRFLVGWLTGALPPSDAVFARFYDVMAPDFVIINPRGVVSARDALCAELRAAHGVHGGPRKAFSIRIDDALSRPISDSHAIVTYQEWQELGGQTSARISTALFRAKNATPNGVEWMHLHETWLPGLAAAV